MTSERFPVLWLAGLSGAGKSTLTEALRDLLERHGWPVTLLDGDAVRSGLNAGLDFSDAGRMENVRRAAHAAGLLSEHSLVLAAFITPRRAMRDLVRSVLPQARLIYLRCPVEVCIRRDPKGLYKKALAGEIPTFTGISDAFEEPEDADLVVDTSELAVDEAVQAILRYAQDSGLLPRPLPHRLSVALEVRDHALLESLRQEAGYASAAEYLLSVAKEVASAVAEGEGTHEAPTLEDDATILERLRQLGYID